MKIYLDNCCFNRPFDNQDQFVTVLETEAKLYIQQMVIDKKIELIWSFILDYENNDNPYIERKERISVWSNLATIDINSSPDIISKAKEIMQLGIKSKDALHISCAIAGNAECFITTDKRILNKTIAGIIIINPIDFIRRYFYD